MKPKTFLAAMACAYLSLANAIDAHCANDSKYNNEPDTLPAQSHTDKGGATVNKPIIRKEGRHVL